MSSLANVTNRLQRTVEALSLAMTAAFFTAVVVGLLCLIGLILAGTFGILHKGDDFGDVGGGGRGGGDVIVVPGMR